MDKIWTFITNRKNAPAQKDCLTQEEMSTLHAVIKGNYIMQREFDLKYYGIAGNRPLPPVLSSAKASFLDEYRTCLINTIL